MGHPWRRAWSIGLTPSTKNSPKRRRLVRLVDHKVIAGVAAGLGDYFDLDPVLFRIGFVVLAFAGGAGLIAYVLWSRTWRT